MFYGIDHQIQRCVHNNYRRRTYTTLLTSRSRREIPVDCFNFLVTVQLEPI